MQARMPTVSTKWPPRKGRRMLGMLNEEVGGWVGGLGFVLVDSFALLLLHSLFPLAS